MSFNFCYIQTNSMSIFQCQNMKNEKAGSLWCLPDSPKSHAHTVVWECCKDDRQSQWGMAKFDPQPTQNPWTDRHQIWNTWLRRGYLPPQKIRGQSAQGFLPPHTWNIHPKPSNVYFFFFSQFFRRSRDALVGPIFTFNTSYDVVLRKEVPFGGEKN